MGGWLRVIWRFFFFVAFTTLCLVYLTLLVIVGKSQKQAGLISRRLWLNHIPRQMGMDIERIGTPVPGPCLYVGNHISYLDPILALLYLDAHVVAKAEVKRWPLVGFGAHLVGTIFVNREDKSSRLETASAIRQALEEKDSILVFPEGTTTAGPGTLPFKPRSFLAAEMANAKVQPFAIRYADPRVAFIGDDTFLPHFFRIFRWKKIKGRIAFGPALSGPETAVEAEKWINDTQLTDHPYTEPHGAT